MGSGPMTGGFDGWLGPSLGGSSGGGAAACDALPQPVGNGPADPGVSPLFSRCDHVHALDASIITGYLSEIYALGVADNPTTDNTLVGTYYSIFFDGNSAPAGNGDGITVKQNTTTDGTDGANKPGLLLQRQFSTPTVPGTAINYRIKYTTGLNNQGGITQRYFVLDNDDNQNQYAVDETTVYKPLVSANWYSPDLGNSDPVTFHKWLLQNRIGGGNNSAWYINSDGAAYKDCLLPEGVATRMVSEQWGIKGAAGGTPSDGSAVGLRITGPATGPGFGDALEACSLWGFLDDTNFGSGQAAGHWEFWTATLTDHANKSMSIHPGLVVINDFASNALAALQFEDGSSSPVSAAGTAALRYDPGANEIQYSKNGGAWTTLV